MLLPILLLTACATETEDLRSWMVQEESKMPRHIPPIPEIRPHTIVDYEMAEAVSPFDPARVEPQADPVKATEGGPDLNRQREPLEAFPLSSLAMVGMLRQGNNVHALIRAAGNVYQISVGNYMGQDHGQVIEIDDTQLTLSEWVENSDGGWTQRTNTLTLQEH